jgi:hypothetical protein
MFRHIKMVNPSNYSDFESKNKLGGHPTDATTTMSQEGFAAMVESFKDPVKVSIDKMEDEVTRMNPVFASPNVENPHGYGYIPSLGEVRVQNSLDIVNQESMLFSIGAITGVSMIVLGIMITSNNN